MITNESATEELAMVSRMLSYQLERDQSLPQAIKVLRDTLPEKYQSSINALERMVSGSGQVNLVGYGYSAFGILNEFAEIVRAEGKDVSQIFACAQGSMRDAVVQARDYWSGFNSLIGYFGIVLMIAISISAIFSFYVLPPFQEMFDTMGGTLPSITAFVLGDNGIFPVVILILTLLVVVCVLCAYHIRVRVAQFRPLSRLASWIPGVKKLSDVYSYFLFVQYSTVLHKSGVPADAAIRHGEAFSNLKHANQKSLGLWRNAVNSAGQMGALLTELEYQCDQVSSMFGKYMIIVRERLTLWVQVILGLLVGTLIVAMYLPIFKMGEVV